MKRFIQGIILVVTILFSTGSTSVFASSQLSEGLQQKLSNSVVLYVGSSKAFVNGIETVVSDVNESVFPLIKDRRTLVPVRFISESLGAKVVWNDSEQAVIVNLNGKTVKLIIGSNKILVNDSEKEIDVPAQIINERTFIPLRALVEALGKNVFWDDRGLIVISDEANIFDSSKDKALIDEAVDKFASTSGNDEDQFRVSNVFGLVGDSDLGRTNVKLDSVLFVNFNKYAYINDISKLEVTDDKGNKIATSNRELRASYYSLNLIHEQKFLPGTRYTVNLKPGFAKDSEGNLSDTYTFTFTTIAIADKETSMATIKTSKGDIVITLENKKMPITVANFVKLANSKFYDGLTFHRVEDWVIQGGDPLGNGTGGSGENIKLETDPELTNVRGSIAMARSSNPDSASSQFYILKTDAPWLDGQYAVFGNVIAGMDVVDKIEIGDKIISIEISR